MLLLRYSGLEFGFRGQTFARLGDLATASIQGPQPLLRQICIYGTFFLLLRPVERLFDPFQRVFFRIRQGQQTCVEPYNRTHSGSHIGLAYAVCVRVCVRLYRRQDQRLSEGDAAARCARACRTLRR